MRVRYIYTGRFAMSPGVCVCVCCNKVWLISRARVCRLSLGCVFRSSIQHLSSRQEPTPMYQFQLQVYNTRHNTHTADCKVVNLRIEGICLMVVSILSCSLTAVCSSCFSCSRNSMNCTAFDLWVVDGCMLSGFDMCLARETRKKCDETRRTWLGCCKFFSTTLPGCLFILLFNRPLHYTWNLLEDH